MPQGLLEALREAIDDIAHARGGLSHDDRRVGSRAAARQSRVNGPGQAGVGHLRTPAAALVEVEERMVTGQGSEVRPEPLQAETRTAVEHHDGVRALTLHPVEEAHAARAQDIARAGPRRLSVSHCARPGLRSRARGAQEDGRNEADWHDHTHSGARLHLARRKARRAGPIAELAAGIVASLSARPTPAAGLLWRGLRRDRPEFNPIFHDERDRYSVPLRVEADVRRRRKILVHYRGRAVLEYVET